MDFDWSPRWLDRSDYIILSITIFGLIARFYQLGWRIAHQDEARVGDWILHYMRTGHWEYRAIIHGPFIPHINGVVFTWLGASDFTARLVIALVGGLLPLVAIILRHRLTNVESIILAVLLGFNPVLLYYSRFMRNDMLVAGFSFFAFALFVRAIDQHRSRYVYLGTGFLALAFTAKENAFLYILAWLGSALLLFDHRLLLQPSKGWIDYGQSLLRSIGISLLRQYRVIMVAVGEFLVILTLFYAPKPALYNVVSNPRTLPHVLDRAWFGTWEKFYGLWIAAGMHKHPYLEFFGAYIEVMYLAAFPISVFAILGFVSDRYTDSNPRDIISFCFYWGIASVFGYPLVIDIIAAWANVHTIVPLTIPAAVGIAKTYRYTRSTMLASNYQWWRFVGIGTLIGGIGVVLIRKDLQAYIGEQTSIALALLLIAGLIGLLLLYRWHVYVSPSELVSVLSIAVLVLFAVQSGLFSYRTVYTHPQDPSNALVQYAQPAGEMQPALGQIQRISADHQGIDIVYYGEEFYSPKSSWKANEDPPKGWFNRLPFPWYFDAFGATVSSTKDPKYFKTHSPPVIITMASDAPGVTDTADDIDQYLTNYRKYRYQQYQSQRPIVIYIKKQ